MEDNQELQNNPPKEEDKVGEIVNQLNESLTGINERIETLQEKIEEQTYVEPEPEPQPQPQWQPKTWDEFPEMAKKAAREVYEETTRQLQQEQEEYTKAEQEELKRIDKEFDQILSNLEQKNIIPRVTNPNDPNDPGRVARKEIFAMGVNMNSTNLEEVAKTRNILSKEGYSFNSESGEMEKTDKRPTPYGKTAPVGSSGGGNSGGSGISYKDIHNLSMDELVRRYEES